MSEEYMTCGSCGKSDATVSYRACGYSADVDNDPNDYEVICDDCEYQHVLDI